MKRFCTTLLLLVFALFLASCSATPADFVALPLAERDGTTDEYTAAEGILVALSVNAPLSGLEFSCKRTPFSAMMLCPEKTKSAVDSV